MTWKNWIAATAATLTIAACAGAFLNSPSDAQVVRCKNPDYYAENSIFCDFAKRYAEKRKEVQPKRRHLPAWARLEVGEPVYAAAPRLPEYPDLQTPDESKPQMAERIFACWGPCLPVIPTFARADLQPQPPKPQYVYKTVRVRVKVATVN